MDVKVEYEKINLNYIAMDEANIWETQVYKAFLLYCSSGDKMNKYGLDKFELWI